MKSTFRKNKYFNPKGTVAPASNSPTARKGGVLRIYTQNPARTAVGFVASLGVIGSVIYLMTNEITPQGVITILVLATVLTGLLIGMMEKKPR